MHRGAVLSSAIRSYLNTPGAEPRNEEQPVFRFNTGHKVGFVIDSAKSRSINIGRRSKNMDELYSLLDNSRGFLWWIGPGVGCTYRPTPCRTSRDHPLGDHSPPPWGSMHYSNTNLESRNTSPISNESSLRALHDGIGAHGSSMLGSEIW
jgi:hypothetical protein